MLGLVLVLGPGFEPGVGFGGDRDRARDRLTRYQNETETAHATD